MPSARSLQQFFQARVPLALAMGVEVLEATPRRIHLRFPLEPNLNHHGTAFGGSLSAAGILGGWSLLHVMLAAQGVGEARTVVAESRTSYREPIAAAFEAVSLAPPQADWMQFRDMLERWGRARLTLRTEIRPVGGDGERVAVIHEGVYVAVLDKA